jgi:GNAT superfamily N-acetyltransferase
LLTIKWRTVNQLVSDGIEDLAAAAWEEVEDDLDTIPLAIDYEYLRTLEKAGNLKLAGCFADGELVGHAIWTVMASPIRRTTLHGFCDTIFMDPQFRGHGLRLVRWCERELSLLGVHKVFIADRPRLRLGHGRHCARLGNVLTRLGYSEAETVYAKVLGDPNVQRKQGPGGLPTGTASPS